MLEYLTLKIHCVTIKLPRFLEKHFPYAKDEELREYAASRQVEIISNTSECQALRKSSLGLSSYVFYKGGSCEYITIDAPCILNVFEWDNKCRISVCDPTHKLDKISIKINKPLHLLAFDDKISVKQGEMVEISVDMTGSVGRPYRAIFKK